jgi:hypothetical protein
MKIAFNTQIDNPVKAVLMPDTYPYIIYEIEDDREQEFLDLGYLVKTSEDFQAYKSSICVEAYCSSLIPTQKEKDIARFTKRAAAKNIIIAEMAADNMERVRNGVWTTSQLMGLTVDPGLLNVLNNISTLSYEIAAYNVYNLTNPLITVAIKQVWIAKLQSHFYLQG